MIRKPLFNCDGCFADGTGECRILETRMRDCPFKKTTTKFYADQYKAAQRLAKLYRAGLFNPEALNNLKEQALATMGLVTE